jgi:hypothetical protein
MSSERTSGDPAEDDFLAELYLRLEERAAARYSDDYDLESASTHYARWLSSITVDQARSAQDPWGRVDADGTVYVRTADGERVVGSWAPGGNPEEALAFFHRRYDSLETDVALLEQRLATTDVTPAAAHALVKGLLRRVSEANAIGDLESLRFRLEALLERAKYRQEEVKSVREQAREEARQVKERIVAEAERIAVEATQWKVSGERLTQLLDEWKAAPHADRAVEAVLWKRLTAARNQFAKRRKQYFNELESERENVRLRKEKIVEEAELLSDSTAWGPTSAAFRDLMRAWKEAGRASREVEADLWKRFRDAQDKFFASRSEVYSAKENELREHAVVKEALLHEAQALVPVTDVRSARTALRSIQERWESAGAIPRDMRDQLESGLRGVEEAVRRAEDAQWRRTNPEALARAQGTVAQLRATVDELESRLANAQERGDQRAIHDTEEALEARRSWLAEAERTLAEFR